MQKKFSELTVNLFSALAENGRVNKTLGVLGAFEKIMAAHRGEVNANVVTAKPLTATEMSELKAVLNGFLSKGESLLLTTEVDPSIIGGMKIQIADKYVDMSMASKIKASQISSSKPCSDQAFSATLTLYVMIARLTH